MQSFCKNVGVVEILANRNSSRVIGYAASLLGETLTLDFLGEMLLFQWNYGFMFWYHLHDFGSPKLCF